MTSKTRVAGSKFSFQNKSQTSNAQSLRLQHGSSYYYPKEPQQQFKPDDLQAMLKSHFNLKQNEDEENEPEEEPVYEHTETEEYDKTVQESEERVLSKSEVSVRLSWLGKTAEGDGYTYLKATCTGMALTKITAITCFKHLQFVDLSNNFLDIQSLQPVTQLPFLVLLQADKNKLTTAALKKCKYLQVLILNHNQLTTVKHVFQPELSTLEVGFNQIEEILVNKMQHLKCLDFRHNAIRELPLSMDFPKLDSLYLAGNKIKSLLGIELLVNLRILHVRNNPIKYLYGFVPELAKLQYLNLRNCKIATLVQIRKLRVLPGLEILILKGTPFQGGQGKEDAEVADDEEDPEIRVQVLATLPKLKRLNKAEVTQEERQEAKELMNQWLEEGEKNDDEEVDEENLEEEMRPDEIE